MEHDVVISVNEHDYCEETGYCKRCGLHGSMIADKFYECRFATNSVSLSHLRAAIIADEKAKATYHKTMEYIERVRERIRNNQEPEGG